MNEQLIMFWVTVAGAFAAIGQLIYAALSYHRRQPMKPSGKGKERFPYGRMSFLVFLTWGAVAVNYMLMQPPQSSFPKWPIPYSPISVVGKEFRNQEVILDGYAYHHCTFDNVTFVYNGTTALQFSQNEIGEYILRSDNPAVDGAVGLMEGFGMLNDLVKVKYLRDSNVVKRPNSPDVMK